MLGRALRWIEEQLPFLVVLLVAGTAFVYLIFEPGRWGRGSGVVAVAVLLAGVLRATLPTPRAGMLAVRGRWVDTVAYLALGGVMLVVDIRLHG
ncbi:MAG: DUF3017 domain-containing protein [Jatrophihabitans sp.]|uniref:DUF3017 domain-containing protein n=1 Tax=Jatrophihabitans sp. TaxID=1932789 RepID=UPI00390FEA4C